MLSLPLSLCISLLSLSISLLSLLASHLFLSRPLSTSLQTNGVFHLAQCLPPLHCETMAETKAVEKLQVPPTRPCTHGGNSTLRKKKNPRNPSSWVGAFQFIWPLVFFLFFHLSFSASFTAVDEKASPLCFSEQCHGCLILKKSCLTLIYCVPRDAFQNNTCNWNGPCMSLATCCNSCR